MPCGCGSRTSRPKSVPTQTRTAPAVTPTVKVNTSSKTIDNIKKELAALKKKHRL